MNINNESKIGEAGIELSISVHTSLYNYISGFQLVGRDPIFGLVSLGHDILSINEKKTINGYNKYTL